MASLVPPARTVRLLPSSRWSRYGLGLLVATKLGDVLTTFVGLRFAGVHEANPITATAIHAVGLVPAVLGLTLATVVVVVVVTEAAARVLAVRFDVDVWTLGALRFVGYVAPSLVYVAVVTHNLVVLAGASAR